MKKIILVGYMGSGKSIIAKELSKKTKIKFVELDHLLEENQQMSVDFIFDTKGELYFRKLENAIFNELLLATENIIISTGGGTPCYYNVHEKLKEHDSIYLYASAATLLKRLENEIDNRPLLKNLKNFELEEYIAKHVFERSFYYNHAKYKIDVNDKTVDQIVTEILSLL